MDKWHKIEDIDDFREYYEFNDYVVIVEDIDDDGDLNDTYTDIAFGIALMPENTKMFFCVPTLEDEV